MENIYADSIKREEILNNLPVQLKPKAGISTELFVETGGTSRETETKRFNKSLLYERRRCDYPSDTFTSYERGGDRQCSRLEQYHRSQNKYKRDRKDRSYSPKRYRYHRSDTNCYQNFDNNGSRLHDLFQFDHEGKSYSSRTCRYRISDRNSYQNINQCRASHGRGESFDEDLHTSSQSKKKCDERAKRSSRYWAADNLDRREIMNGMDDYQSAMHRYDTTFRKSSSNDKCIEDEDKDKTTLECDSDLEISRKIKNLTKIKMKLATQRKHAESTAAPSEEVELRKFSFENQFEKSNIEFNGMQNTARKVGHLGHILIKENSESFSFLNTYNILNKSTLYNQVIKPTNTSIESPVKSENSGKIDHDIINKLFQSNNIKDGADSLSALLLNPSVINLVKQQLVSSRWNEQNKTNSRMPKKKPSNFKDFAAQSFKQSTLNSSPIKTSTDQHISNTFNQPNYQSNGSHYNSLQVPYIGNSHFSVERESIDNGQHNIMRTQGFSYPYLNALSPNPNHIKSLPVYNHTLNIQSNVRSAPNYFATNPGLQSSYASNFSTQSRASSLANFYNQMDHQRNNSYFVSNPSKYQCQSPFRGKVRKRCNSNNRRSTFYDAKSSMTYGSSHFRARAKLTNSEVSRSHHESTIRNSYPISKSAECEFSKRNMQNPFYAATMSSAMRDDAPYIRSDDIQELLITEKVSNTRETQKLPSKVPEDLTTNSKEIRDTGDTYASPATENQTAGTSDIMQTILKQLNSNHLLSSIINLFSQVCSDSTIMKAREIIEKHENQKSPLASNQISTENMLTSTTMSEGVTPKKQHNEEVEKSPAAGKNKKMIAEMNRINITEEHDATPSITNGLRSHIKRTPRKSKSNSRCIKAPASNESEEITKESRTTSKFLLKQKTKVEEQESTLNAKNVEKTKTAINPMKNTAKRGKPFTRTPSYSTIPDNCSTSTVNQMEDMSEVEKTTIKKNKVLTRTVKDYSTIKNNNPDWHYLNKIMKCQLCGKAVGRCLVRHFVNVHPNREVFPSRIRPDVACLLRKPGYVHESERIANKRPSYNCQYRQLCYFCNEYKSLVKINWIIHMSIHTGYYQYKCFHCLTKFSTIKSNHKCEGDTIQKIDVPLSQKGCNLLAFICDLCNFVRFDQFEMEQHLRCEHDDSNVTQFKKRIFLSFPRKTKKSKTTDKLEKSKESSISSLDWEYNPPKRPKLVADINQKPEWQENNNYIETEKNGSENEILLNSDDSAAIIVTDAPNSSSEENSQGGSKVTERAYLTSSREGSLADEYSDEFDSNWQSYSSDDALARSHLTKRHLDGERLVANIKNIKSHLNNNPNIILTRIDNIGYSRLISVGNNITFCCFNVKCEFESPNVIDLLSHIEVHPLTWFGFCATCNTRVHNDQTISLEIEHMFEAHYSKEDISVQSSVSFPLYEIWKRNQDKITAMPEEKLYSAPSTSTQEVPNILGKANKTSPMSTTITSNKSNVLLHRGEDDEKVVLKAWGKYFTLKSQKNSKEMLQQITLYALYKCMEINCSFATNKSTIMLIHLRHHKNHSFPPIETLSQKDIPSWLECAYCDGIGNSANELVQHIRDEHRFSLYQCPFCFYRSCTAHNVLVHLKQFHHSKPASVLVCNGVPNIYANEIAAMEDIRKEKILPIRCTGGCNQITYAINNFIHHLNTSSAHSFKFICQICGLHILISDATKHLLCHNIGLFQCFYCNYGVNDVKRIQIHMCNNHPAELQYICLRLTRNREILSDEQLGSVESTLIVHLDKKIDPKLCQTCPYTDEQLNYMNPSIQSNSNMIELSESLAVQCHSESNASSLVSTEIPMDPISNISDDMFFNWDMVASSDQHIDTLCFKDLEEYLSKNFNQRFE